MKEISMREGQTIALNILKKVAEICEINHWTYYLTYGTLIGAVRHKGFIPWDDDLDIMMPRKDYLSLLNYMETHKEELYPLQIFSNYNNKEYPYMIARVSNSEYVLDVDNEKPYGIGVFIDIYPLDGVGNDEEECGKCKIKTSRYASLCFLSTRVRCEKGNTKSKLRRMIKFPAFLYSKMMGRDYFFKKLESEAQKHDYGNSKYIACLVWGTDGARGVYPKEWFDETLLVPFEDSEFRIPKEYDKILRKMYGNYMQLPPEEDRIGHHFYKIYRK